MVDRDALIAQLRTDGLHVTEWTDAPGTVYEAHAHRFREVRVVLAGEITFVTGSAEVVVGPGERIDFEPGQRHAARVGALGATYLAGTGRPGWSAATRPE